MSIVAKINRRVLRMRGMSSGARYLDTYGWQTSSKQDQPVDSRGNPIPWITYPAFAVLDRVVQKHHRVFEYGCGNSSLWWSSKAKSVVSVEHNEEWSKILASRAPSNLTVVLKPLHEAEDPSELISQFLANNPNMPKSGHRDIDIEHGILSEGFLGYASEITKHSPPYDIVIVDGMARSLCAWMAAHHLTPDGFIVFDNSDRWQYNPGYQVLYDLGFGRVDFWGPGPVNTEQWCTSIFHRTKTWSEPLIQLNPNVRSAIDWIIAARS